MRLYLIVTFFIERQKRLVMTPSDPTSEQKKDEEKWPLRDVIFVEDVRSVPTGRVLKVDGHYAAVRFPSTHTRERDAKDADDILQDCRLMRKDELQVSFSFDPNDCAKLLYIFL